MTCYNENNLSGQQKDHQEACHEDELTAMNMAADRVRPDSNSNVVCNPSN